MKKATYTNGGNKMVINTGHKAFDAQTVCIAPGNVIAPTQYSAHIRAFNDTTHWQEGQKHREGFLQNFDLEKFDRLPAYIRKRVEEKAKDKTVILYRFSHCSNGKRVVHCYIITDTEHNLLDWFDVGPTFKSYGVMITCAEYVSHWRRDGVSEKGA